MTYKDMDIHATEGTKVIFHAKLESDFQKKHFSFENEKLKDGKIYTILYTVVNSLSTNVYLREIPGFGFNSVCFEEVEQ